MKSNAEKNKASIQNTSVTIWNKINRTLNPLMENIEKLLCLWIEDQSRHRMLVSLNIIQFKVKSTFIKRRKQ